MSTALLPGAIGVRPPVASNQIGWLIDNAEAYAAMIGAIRRARRSVAITQLAFDPDCTAHDPDVVIAEELVDASRRGVDVRILLNASLLLDTTKTLRAYFHAKNAPGIVVRGVDRFPQLLHAKMLIVDEQEAFLLGSPFVNGYWDDARHRPEDGRRPARELGGRPLHDVSVRVRGTPVERLASAFAELWHDRPVPDRRPDDAIAWTTPRGQTAILDATRDAIARAGSSIYIEHQYLSARPVVAALAAALHRAPRLEVVVVLNQNPDVTAYRGWQNARLREAGLFQHRRIGFFTLWTAEPRDDRCAVNQVFVHSKVMIVDDAWATVGSANLDGVSLHSYGDDFSWPVMRRVFRDVRNIDVNVVTESGAARELRERLWTEHLGSMARGASLRTWRECAARNAARLGAGGFIRPETFVLPYSERSRPRDQLADVGVAADASLDVRFDPSWLEVHCSPNWVRNMFV